MLFWKLGLVYCRAPHSFFASLTLANESSTTHMCYIPVLVDKIRVVVLALRDALVRPQDV